MFQLQRTYQFVRSHEQTGSNFRTLSVPVKWYIIISNYNLIPTNITFGRGRPQIHCADARLKATNVPYAAFPDCERATIISTIRKTIIVSL